MDGTVSILINYLAIAVLLGALAIVVLGTLIVLAQGTQFLLRKINVQIIREVLKYRRFSFLKKQLSELERTGALEIDEHYRAVVAKRGAPQSLDSAYGAEDAAIHLDMQERITQKDRHAEN